MTSVEVDPLAELVRGFADLLDRYSARVRVRSPPTSAGPATPAGEPTLTPGAVARRIGKNRTTVTRLCESGAIAAVNVGTASLKHWRVSESALAAFLAAR